MQRVAVASPEPPARLRLPPDVWAKLNSKYVVPPVRPVSQMLIAPQAPSFLAGRLSSKTMPAPLTWTYIHRSPVLFDAHVGQAVMRACVYPVGHVKRVGFPDAHAPS